MATKQYAFGDSEATGTDAYVNSIAGERKNYQKFDQSSAASGAWYSQDSEPVYRNKCSRAIVIMVSGFLFLLGVAVMIVAKVQQDKKFLTLCPNCNVVITVMYIFGGSLAFIALLGLVGALTRIRLFAYVYTLFLIILALACMAAGFAVVAFENNLKQSEITKLWDDAVSDNDDFICDFQHEFNCSGFTTCCNYWAPNVCNYTAKECLPRCNNSNANIETCQSKVESEVKSHFKPAMGVTFGLAFVLLVTAVASVRMTRKSFD